MKKIIALIILTIVCSCNVIKKSQKINENIINSVNVDSSFYSKNISFSKIDSAKGEMLILDLLPVDSLPISGNEMFDLKNFKASSGKLITFNLKESSNSEELENDSLTNYSYQTKDSLNIKKKEPSRNNSIKERINLVDFIFILIILFAFVYIVVFAKN